MKRNNEKAMFAKKHSNIRNSKLDDDCMNSNGLMLNNDEFTKKQIKFLKEHNVIINELKDMCRKGHTARLSEN